MQQKIALKYTNAVYFQNIPTAPFVENNSDLAASFGAEMIQLGYMPSKELVEAMTGLPRARTVSVFSDVITALKQMKGADVKYVPFYPNFPQQVMDMSHAELFINAILHYWTGGHWRPDYEALPREVKFEDVKFKEIGVVGADGFAKIFQRLVSSNDSLTGFDKETVEYFLNNERVQVSYDIPYKETMCIVAGHLLERGIDIAGFVKNTTDVLRVATYMSGGDVSLADNTKFKSFPRRTRKALVGILKDVISAEDVNRHRNKWIKLFHNLHVGEYSAHVNAIAKKVRENKKIETYNGRVQAMIDRKDIQGAVNLLVQRPSEFARRLDHLYRIRSSKNGSNAYITEKFVEVTRDVPTRILMQVLGALSTRTSTTTQRVVFPKGNVQRGIILRDHLEALPRVHITAITNEIREVMQDRFSELDSLGNVYVDPELMDCPVPTQMRSMSDGAFAVARGTKLPFGDKKTLRFFIYWVGQDIDLSATMHDENFNNIGHVSYTQLKSGRYQSYHSGDITRAPNGASEFIDIDVTGAYESGARYIGMNVLVYSGPTFKEHKAVYAGWMTRDHANSNEIYDPKTVEQKIDLQGENRNCIPVLFDLKERKAIWADVATSRGGSFGGNNVESNRATISETMEAIADTSRKVSLYELFSLHAAVRGTVVDNAEDADTVFSATKGDVTPFDISVINSEFVV